MRNRIVVGLSILCLALPLSANAIPITWNFSNGGIFGTITGDPERNGAGLADRISFNELDWYSFEITLSGGPVTMLTGTTAAGGGLNLDDVGNIIGRRMAFAGPGSGRLTVFADSWRYNPGPGMATIRGSGTWTKVPEPGTLALLAAGVIGMGLVRRRRKA